MSSRFVATACPHDCPSACAIEAEILDDGSIGRLRGAADNDYTAGVICAKVANYRERVHHPDRLGRPLKRIGEKGEGKFTEIGWDEALDEVAHRFKEAAARYGPQTVWPYFFAGTMGYAQRDAIHRLRHVMKYSNQDQTICVTLGCNGWIAGTGDIRGIDPREAADSELIVVWGGNPVSTQVNFMSHVTRARKAQGAKLVVIDAYRTPTAAAADMFLAIRPGTDGALATSVMHVLFKEGFADHAYMAEYTDAPGRLEAHLETRSPAWASPITGIPEAEIVAFARLYGSTKRSFIRAGYGFSRSRNGAANMHAVSCLPAVTGAWRYRGGGGLHTNASLYSRLDQTMIMALDEADSSIRALDMCRIGAILDRDEASLLGGPPVTAMLMQNVNPADVAPESDLVCKGLARDDLFLCVHEQFITRTARYADIVLPATMFLEHEDFYKGGGHTYLQVHRAVIDPFEQCRSNHDVICALGQRLGAEHPGFAMSAWQIIDATLKASGLPGADEVAERRWIDLSLDFEEAHYLNGFAHADGKFHFSPDWAAIGSDHELLPDMPDHLNNIDEVSAEKPFRLVTAPARRFLNTTFTEMPSSRSREGRPRALIHPATCQRLGVVAGDRVRLGNQRGNVVVLVECFDGLCEDVIIVEGLWPAADFEGGIGINSLTSADRGPPAGGAVFHDTSIWVRPCRDEAAF